MDDKMDKFFMWVGRNRDAIGYTIGCLCLLSAGFDFAKDDITNGIMFTIMGVAISFDVWSTR